MRTRRFPRPWRIVEHAESIEVRDAAGGNVAYVYFAHDEQRQSVTGRMSWDAARRIALNIARLPDLLPAKPIEHRPCGTGELEAATILGQFGEVPEDFAESLQPA